MFKKIIILSLVIAALAVNAEETVTGEIRLEEDVTTTTGFDSTVGDQAKNVTVITKKDIEEQGYKTLEDVLKNAPGVTFVNSGSGPSIDIRGQGDKAVAKVKVLVDGVAMNVLDTSHGTTPINTVAVSNIERIEIIPGGGAVLYGSGTVGGVVNIITKKPTETGGVISAQYGSFDDMNGGINAGFKVSDKLYFNFDFTGRDANGYRDKDEMKSDYWAGSLRYDITENQSLTFRTSRYTEDGTATSSLTKKQMDEDRRQAGSTISEYDLTKTEFVLDYRIQALKNLTIDATGYYQETEETYNDDYGTFQQYGIFKDEKTGFNLKGKYDYSRGEVIVGYNFLDNNMTRDSRGFVSAYNDLNKTTNSIYILEKHNILDTLQVIAGFREEWAGYDIDRVSGSTKINDSRTEDNSAWELALNYLYRDTGNTYIRYEHGFVSPSPTQLTNKNAAGYYLNDLKSETYDTFEIGMKDVIFGSYVSLTGFYTKTNDEIFQNVMSGKMTGMTWTFENLDKTERKGAEAFLEQYFGPLTVNESVAYINTEITEGSRKGQQIPYVPNVKATLGLSYEIIKNLDANVNFNYYRSAKDTYGNSIRPYSTTDLAVEYGFENGFGIIAGVNNVFGEKYNVYQNGNAYIPAEEASYYIGAKYEF